MALEMGCERNFWRGDPLFTSLSGTDLGSCSSLKFSFHCRGGTFRFAGSGVDFIETSIFFVRFL